MKKLLEVKNQCDGCQAGMRKDSLGFHYATDGRIFSICQKERYQPRKSTPSFAKTRVHKNKKKEAKKTGIYQ